ncbi:MAG: endolytic transglycosylase MltG, partial [Ruthenibacterium sp.]
MSRRRQRSGPNGCLIAVIVFVLLIALAIGGAWMWANTDIKGNRGEPVKEATILVEMGSGPLTIGRQLQQEGIIKNAQLFRLYIRQKKIDTLQYGEFTLSSDMSYDALIAVLQTTNQDRETVRVTFPEGIP